MHQLQVSAIKDGTVIDHIDSKSTFKVASILNILEEGRVVLIGMNLSSGQLGKKGIIKIEGKNLTQEEANKIALIAPDATLNIIKNYEVVEKRRVSLPEELVGIVKCFNPNCISNHEKVKTHLHVIKKTPLKLRCHYCERCMEGKDIELL
ncbi:MAG TPA: aspartate carbamoyltransferase regulatory subunit [Candidatus Hypogeohydataceae bacterium YC38]